MTKRRTELPRITRTDKVHGTDEAHPAYAAIRASRVSGSTPLFGSDFVHNHYVVVQIAPATLTRNLSNDWIHGGLNDYIEVAMSEAQWATFVSTLNSGSGTPCTLTEKDGCLVAGLPDPASRNDQFNAEMQNHLKEVLADVEALRAGIADAKSVTGRADLLAKADRLAQQLRSNLPFVADQFGEHVEKVTEHAKIEVNAYLTNAVQRAGLQALAGEAAGPLALPQDPKEIS